MAAAAPVVVSDAAKLPIRGSVFLWVDN